MDVIWIWEKEQGANFMLCKYQPYKVHEIVSVFSKATHKYFLHEGYFEIAKKRIAEACANE